MLDVGHTRVNYDTVRHSTDPPHSLGRGYRWIGSFLRLFWAEWRRYEIYDFFSQKEGVLWIFFILLFLGIDEDDITVHFTGELQLPDGRLLGHRTLARYYKQKFPTQDENRASICPDSLLYASSPHQQAAAWVSRKEEHSNICIDQVHSKTAHRKTEASRRMITLTMDSFIPSLSAWMLITSDYVSMRVWDSIRSILSTSHTDKRSPSSLSFLCCVCLWILFVFKLLRQI